MRRIHLLLAGQSLIIVLLSINRLSRLTLDYVAPNEFLRWVDLNNMIFLPLASVVLSYLLKLVMEQEGPASNSRSAAWLGALFIVGIYLFGAGYGDHEVTNYLHTRFCLDDTSDLCRIVIYNDDEFSHYVFFLGFILINAALMLIQDRQPRRVAATPGDMLLIAVNGLFIAVGIFANLAFEEIGLDLYVVALLCLVSLYLLLGRGRTMQQVPVVAYFALAFALSTLSTFVVKVLG